MIKKLQFKFVAVTMGSLIVIFLLVLLTLNMFMRNQNNQFTDQQLQQVADEDGFQQAPKNETRQTEEAPPSSPPSAFSPAQNRDALRDGRYFYVKLDASQQVFEVDAERMFDFTESEAEAYALQALKTGKASGTVDSLRYLAVEKDYGTIVVFAQQSIEDRILSQLIQTSLLVAGIAFVVLFLLSLFLSKWAVAPVKDAFDKQRRFISDASHELKTPLTIISANTDVLESQIGENVMLYQIKNQTNRMGKLVQALLSLARAEEGVSNIVMTQFNLSKAVLGTTLEFESHAFEEGRSLSYEVAENILYTGDETQLRQLTAILIDNAIKHSDRGGRVEVSLKLVGSRPLLTVYNTGAGIPEGEREQIFDRFYRSDASRSRETGGYGLGLAIARSIAEAHRGKISVDSAAGQWVKFIISL